ncbi:hypothetical protein Taro_011779 [Colocasia esculenta]|uniref:Uncharacterized protein n=1 Tax=Colocasia esculenta TaxID=4460 RepID=A0A843U6W7_COLES|nr:hypothetical protein [Colocasia esculenta]
MHMGVDDRVFVPPSDVYMVMSTFLLPMGCLCLHKVTCLYVCRFMTPEDLNICLYVCHFLTSEDLNMCLYVCRFMTPEDLTMCLRGSCNNLWRLCAGERRRSRPRRTTHHGAPRTFSRHVRPILSSRTDSSLSSGLGVCASVGRYMVMSTFLLPMGCLCLHKVTCLYVCRFITPEDLNMCLYVCRFLTSEDLNMCLYVCRFMTPEDLTMCLRGSCFVGGHTGGGARPAEARTARASRRSEPAETNLDLVLSQEKDLLRRPTSNSSTEYKFNNNNASKKNTTSNSSMEYKSNKNDASEKITSSSTIRSQQDRCFEEEHNSNSMKGR